MTVQQNGKKPFHWLSLVQIIVSTLGILLNLMGALVLFVIGIVFKFVQPMGETTLQMFNYGWGALVICILLVPSVVLSIKRLTNWQIKIPALKNGVMVSSIALVAVPIMIGLGSLLAKQTTISWLILPPMQALIILIPLWWLIEVGGRKLKPVDPQERWGVLSFGLLITPVVLLTIEIVLIIVIIILLAIWLVNFPGLGEVLNRIATRISISQADPEAIVRIFRPFVASQPWVYVTIGVVLGGFIPLIEEVLKPLAVWGFSFKKPSLSMGLVLGLISGAAFAFWESSGNLASVGASDWAVMVTGRLGTGLLHTINSGLIGFGLAAAWTKRKYLWMAGSILLAFIQHAIWNVLVLLDASGEMIGFSSIFLTEKLAIFPSGIFIILLVLLTFMLCSLLLVNYLIQREEKQDLAKIAESDHMMVLETPSGTQ